MASVVAEDNCCKIALSDNVGVVKGVVQHPQEPESFGNLDQMISAYERDHANLAIQLHSLDDNGWNHQAWLIQGAEEILLKDTVGGLLWIALFDSVHHRGQLSTYIRPMGGKVPSIYGPSADDAGEQH